MGIPPLGVAAEANCVPYGGNRSFLCLCLDITEHDIDREIAEGFTHSELVKRYTGSFMGPCQGKSCMDSLLEMLAWKTGQALGHGRGPTMRPPAHPVSFATVASFARPLDDEDDEKGAV